MSVQSIPTVIMVAVLLLAGGCRGTGGSVEAEKPRAVKTFSDMAPPAGELDLLVYNHWALRYRAPADQSCAEWSIDYSPNRKFCVLYVLYERSHEMSREYTLTTHTLYRIEKGRPHFIRHFSWPGMAHHAVSDDGTLLVLEFVGSTTTRWTCVFTDDHREDGMLFGNCPGCEVTQDNEFIIDQQVAEYLVACRESKAEIRMKRFCKDAVFFRRTVSEPSAYLPSELSPTEARLLIPVMEELKERAGEVLAKDDRNAAALYVKAYAEEALPALKNEHGPCLRKQPIKSKRVAAVLEAVIKDP